jgi:hypothetical protein
MNLNDIFQSNNSNLDDAQSSNKSVFVKFDTKTQFIRFRFLEDFDTLRANAQVSHWVDGVGSVKCNHLPIYDKMKGLIFLWDGWGKDKTTGVRINKKPEHNCVFCAETRKVKDEAKENGADMQEIIKAGNLHRRSQNFVANVVYEVLERKAGQKRPVVVQPASVGILRIRINDLFSERGKGEYKTLDNFNNIKGSVTDHWFTMSGEYKITPDDSVTDSEREQFGKSDAAEVRQPLTYEEGLAKFKQKNNAVSQAEPFQEDDIAF